jgi:toxin ParE1/3/4
MRHTVIKSPDARRDIDDIAANIAQHSVDAALRWYDELDRFFERIAQFPGIGTPRGSFVKGLRSVPFGNYLVFFRKGSSGVEIFRIIHGARRWRRIIKDLH